MGSLGSTSKEESVRLSKKQRLVGIGGIKYPRANKSLARIVICRAQDSIHMTFCDF